MKAQIVQYDHTTGSYDPCRGYESRTYKNKAIFIPGLDLLVVPEEMGVWSRFYLVDKNEDGTFSFHPREVVRPLPEKGWEVVEEQEIDDQLAQDAAIYARMHERFQKIRRTFGEQLFLVRYGRHPSELGL